MMSCTPIRALREAARVLEIDLLGYVIVGDEKADPSHRGCYSFREAGLLWGPFFFAPGGPLPGVLRLFHQPEQKASASWLNIHIA